MRLKILARKIVRRAARLPLAGRFVATAVAIYRLPEMRQEHLALTGNPDPDAAPRPGQPLPRSVAELRIRQRALDNLVLSLPVTLREFRHALQALQRSGDSASGQAPQDAAARILAPEKLAAAGAGQLKLNLAYGGAVRDGYLNVDRIARQGIDILAEPVALPLAPGLADEIRASHLFEAYTQQELRERILPACLALLKPGGRLCARVTDGGAAIAAYAAGTCGDDVLRALLYGGDGAGSRVNMLTPASLAALLADAGFDAPAAAGAGDGAPYAFDISATRPRTAGTAS
jgi:hypothetical protein